MSRTERRGFVLPLALTVIVLLVIGVGAVHLMTRQTYRELEKLDGFLRAVAVAEACFQRQVGRLESRPWSERWFRGSPDMGRGAWMEGSYEYLIADGDRDLEADLLVRAEAGGSKAVMYWKLWADGTRLDPYRRVRATYFTYVDPATPVSGTGLAGLVPGLQEAMGQREANRAWAEELEARMGPGMGLQDLPVLLNFPPGSAPGNVPPPPTNGPAVPPGAPAIEIPELPGPASGTDPRASPASVADLGPLHVEVQEALEKLSRAERRVNRNLGGAPPVPGMPPESTFLDLEQRVAERIAACGTVASTEPPCPDEERSKLDRCRASFDRIHLATRPGFAAVIGDIFRIKDDLWDVMSEIDAMRGTPEVGQGAVDAVTARARASIEEAEDLSRELDRLYDEAHTLLSGACEDLWVPVDG